MQLTRLQLGIAAGVIVVLIGFMVRDIIVKKIAQSGTLTRSNVAGLTYRIPKEYQPITLVEAEKKIGVVVKLLRTDPISQISVRIDPNMPLEAGISNTKLADYLQQNVAKLYRQYPQFNQVYTGSPKLLGQSASELLFTYMGLDKQTSMQMDVVALVLNNKPYFFEFQSPEKDYQKLQSAWKGFQRSLQIL